MAFYAYVTEKTTLTDDSIVVFDHIVTNYGDAYSDISGTFTGKNSCSLFAAMYEKISVHRKFISNPRNNI